MYREGREASLAGSLAGSRLAASVSSSSSAELSVELQREGEISLLYGSLATPSRQGYKSPKTRSYLPGTVGSKYCRLWQLRDKFWGRYPDRTKRGGFHSLPPTHTIPLHRRTATIPVLHYVTEIMQKAQSDDSTRTRGNLTWTTGTDRGHKRVMDKITHCRHWKFDSDLYLRGSLLFTLLFTCGVLYLGQVTAQPKAALAPRGTAGLCWARAAARVGVQDPFALFPLENTAGPNGSPQNQGGTYRALGYGREHRIQQQHLPPPPTPILGLILPAFPPHLKKIPHQGYLINK